MGLKLLSVLKLPVLVLTQIDHGGDRGGGKTVPKLSGLNISLILDLRAKDLFGDHIFRSK